MALKDIYAKMTSMSVRATLVTMEGHVPKETSRTITSVSVQMNTLGNTAN